MDEFAQRIVHGDDATVIAHLAALDEIWQTVKDTAALHYQLLEAITALPDSDSPRSDFAVITVGCHGLNLFGELIGASVRGSLDVALHLFRALADCQGLAFGVGTSESMAEQFLEDEQHLAAHGRREMVAMLRSEGMGEAANKLEEHFKSRGTILNSSSHVSVLHIDRLLTMPDGAFQPQIHGRLAPDHVQYQTATALEAEFDLLISLWGVRNARLAPTWSDRIDALQLRTRQWELTLKRRDDSHQLE